MKNKNKKNDNLEGHDILTIFFIETSRITTDIHNNFRSFIAGEIQNIAFFLPYTRVWTALYVIKYLQYITFRTQNDVNKLTTYGYHRPTKT